MFIHFHQFSSIFIHFHQGSGESRDTKKIPTEMEVEPPQVVFTRFYLHCIAFQADLKLQVDGVVRLLNLHPLHQGDHPYEGSKLFLGGSLEDRSG